MATLHILRPRTANEFNANVKRITQHLSDVIATLNPLDLFDTLVFIKLWYLFDPETSSHTLVLFADDEQTNIPRFRLPLLVFVVLEDLVYFRSLDTELLATAKEISSGEYVASITDAAGNAVAKGDELTILMVIVKHFNNTPAVPIPKAAEIFQVEEKTVRNRIQKKELEAFERRGTLWVTIRSIRRYFETHYHPTSYFDLWADIEEELKKKNREIQ